MRRTFYAFGLILCLLHASSAFAREAPPSPLALLGGVLIDGALDDDGRPKPPLKDAVVLVEGGKIACVGKREDCPIPEDFETFDASGSWITPGLVDAHVHLSSTGWADSLPGVLDLGPDHSLAAVVADLRDHPEKLYRQLLCSGVTALLDVGGYPWRIMQRNASRRSTQAPHQAVTGPGLTTLAFMAGTPGESFMIETKTPEQARRHVDYVADSGADAVKLWLHPVLPWETLEPLVRSVGEQVRKRGIRFVVHATGLREARLAVEAGAHVLVHSVFDQPVDDELIQLIVERDVAYMPTLAISPMVASMKTSIESGRPPQLDDPNDCLDAEFRAKIASTPHYELGPLGRQEHHFDLDLAAANLRKLHEAGAKIAVGTDAGSPMVPHGATIYREMEAMQAAGLSPLAVIRAATYGGAFAMDRADEIGTIEKGRVADLLLLGADPSRNVTAFRELRWVVRGGALRRQADLRPRVAE